MRCLWRPTPHHLTAERNALPDCRYLQRLFLARHAVLKVAAGVSMHEIAAFLGHSVAGTTELYAHHYPDFMQAAGTALKGRGKTVCKRAR